MLSRTQSEILLAISGYLGHIRIYTQEDETYEMADEAQELVTKLAKQLFEQK